MRPIDPPPDVRARSIAQRFGRRRHSAVRGHPSEREYRLSIRARENGLRFSSDFSYVPIGHKSLCRLTIQLPSNNLSRNLSICLNFRERRFWQSKTHGLPKKETPVFTVAGQYTTREDGRSGRKDSNLVLHYCNLNATDDEQFLEIGRTNTVKKMAPHLTHIGVHDHGFNNVSTYGNLRRNDP